MIKRIVFCVLMSMGLHTFLCAQTQQDTIIENGKMFLSHQVEQGQTLYRLSKMYDILIEEIILYNPNAENGIQIGETIKIYIGDEKKKEPEPRKLVSVKTDSNNVIHIVEAGETLYRISRKYNVTIERLKELNPELTETLSIGQQIVISTSEADEKPSVLATEPDAEQEIFTEKYQEKKASYNVFALIPLYLSEKERIDTTTFKTISDYTKFKAFDFLQFYEGLLLAVEDVKTEGVKINFYVEDINELNVSKLQEMILQGKFEQADLIIGPFFSNGFSILCDYAKNKNITLVNPFSISFDDCNARVFKATTSYYDQAAQFANYICSRHQKAKIILLSSQNASESNKANIYKSALKNTFQKHSKNFPIQEVKHSGGTVAIKNVVDPNCENFVFAFFNGEVAVTNFIQRMYATKLENITLVAPVSWNRYDNIETEYFMRLKTHYINQFFVDFTDPKIIAFIERFRERYNIEPTLEQFAFQGYDFSYYFLTALIKYGNNLDTEINNISDLPLLSTQFCFKKKDKRFFENTFVNIYKLEDYKYIDILKNNQEKQEEENVQRNRRR